MNIAFPALLLFLIVLPGIVIRYTYTKGFWGSKSPASFQSLSDEIAYGVVWAIALHLAWGSVVYSLGFGRPDLRVVLILLAGSWPGKLEQFGEVLDVAVGSPYKVGLYFLSLIAVSAALGFAAHGVVRGFQLDTKYDAFRFKNDWYYLLSGEVLCFPRHLVGSGGRPESPDGVYLSAVVKHGKDDYLYRGVVSDWTLDAKGELDRVLLRAAHRRRLSDDREPGSSGYLAAQAHDKDSRYYTIEGSFLMLRYQEMATLNIEYIYLQPQLRPPADPILQDGEDCSELLDPIPSAEQRFMEGR